MECTSSAVRHLPFQSLQPKVKHASPTRYVSKPRFPAILTVASTELLVITPVTTRVLRFAAFNMASRPVPMNALFVVLTRIVSVTRG